MELIQKYPDEIKAMHWEIYESGLYRAMTGDWSDIKDEKFHTLLKKFIQDSEELMKYVGYKNENDIS